MSDAPCGTVCYVVDEARYYMKTPDGWESYDLEGDLDGASVTYATFPEEAARHE